MASCSGIFRKEVVEAMHLEIHRRYIVHCAKKRQSKARLREVMKMLHTQLLRDITDLEGAFKRDYNQLRRNCVVLNK